MQAGYKEVIEAALLHCVFIHGDNQTGVKMLCATITQIDSVLDFSFIRTITYGGTVFDKRRKANIGVLDARICTSHTGGGTWAVFTEISRGLYGNQSVFRAVNTLLQAVFAKWLSCLKNYSLLDHITGQLCFLCKIILQAELMDHFHCGIKGSAQIPFLPVVGVILDAQLIKFMLILALERLQTFLLPCNAPCSVVSLSSSMVCQELHQAKLILKRGGEVVCDAQQFQFADDYLVTEEVRFDLRRIFGLLYANGADVNEICRISGKTLKERYAPEPVAEFLNM